MLGVEADVTERCESDSCISLAAHVLVFDDVTPTAEISFCDAHFRLIEERCAAAGAERKALIAGGVSERMADRIVAARIERRAV